MASVDDSEVITDFDGFIRAAQPCVDAFKRWAGCFNPVIWVDHISYKCGDAREYVRMRSILESGSAYMYQSIISGRRIALLKLRAPLVTNFGDIWFVELSSQKADGSQVSGFDHIEVYPAMAGDVDSVVAKLRDSGFYLAKVVRPHHTTHDAALSEGLEVRLEEGRLIDKIKKEL